MHPSILALFAEHENPTHCGWQHAHAQLAPTVKFAATAQQQTALFRELSLDAEMLGQDPALNGRLDAIHQKMTRIDKNLPTVIRQCRDIAHAFRELHAEIAEAKRFIMQHGSGVATPMPIMAPVAPTVQQAIPEPETHE